MERLVYISHGKELIDFLQLKQFGPSEEQHADAIVPLFLTFHRKVARQRLLFKLVPVPFPVTWSKRQIMFKSHFVVSSFFSRYDRYPGSSVMVHFALVPVMTIVHRFFTCSCECFYFRD